MAEAYRPDPPSPTGVNIFFFSLNHSLPDDGRCQPRSQHCLLIALAQGASFSILIGRNLNDESVRKILKTQLRYEISNGLQLQSTNDQETVLQFT